jgi:hypothetical protein
MRVSKVFLGITVLAVLSGCAAGTPAPPEGEALAGAGESAAKSAVTTAKTAVLAFFIDNPGQETVSAEQLGDYGYGAGGVPVAFHVTGPDLFCVDAVAASGARFKATGGAGLADGRCVDGEDY